MARAKWKKNRTARRQGAHDRLLAKPNKTKRDLQELEILRKRIPGAINTPLSTNEQL
jgi:hypothetical protein